MNEMFESCRKIEKEILWKICYSAINFKVCKTTKFDFNQRVEVDGNLERGLKAYIVFFLMGITPKYLCLTIEHNYDLFVKLMY